MILPALVLLFAAVITVFYLRLRKGKSARDRWRTAVSIGLGVGAARALFASLGWYVVEHTGGPLQVPAFALAMLAWPEAAILSRRRVTPVPGEFYVALSFLLVASTVIFAGLVAL